MTLQWLLGWWNLLFVVPFFLALTYVGLYAVSGIGFGDADADADTDADAEAGADAGADADADADADSEVEADADSETEHGAQTGGGSAMFDALSAVFGLGRAPLSILLMILMLAWGFFGFLANLTLFPKVEPPVTKVWTLSVPLALVGGLLTTRIIAGLVGRYLPTHESYALRRHELLGATGEALYDIDQTFGMVAVRDSNHDLFQVPCRVRADQSSIPKGSKVKLIAWNGRQQLYYVTAAEAAPVESAKL